MSLQYPNQKRPGHMPAMPAPQHCEKAEEKAEEKGTPEKGTPEKAEAGLLAKNQHFLCAIY